MTILTAVLISCSILLIAWIASITDGAEFGCALLLGFIGWLIMGLGVIGNTEESASYTPEESVLRVVYTKKLDDNRISLFLENNQTVYINNEEQEPIKNLKNVIVNIPKNLYGKLLIKKIRLDIAKNLLKIEENQ